MNYTFQHLYRDKATIIGTVSSAASSIIAQVRSPGFLPTNLEGLLAATLTSITIVYIGVKIYKLANERDDKDERNTSDRARARRKRTVAAKRHKR